MSIVLFLILGIVSVGIIVIILMQSDRSAGLGAIGGDQSSDSYWSKNKGRSFEGALERYTKIGAVIYLIVAFALNFMLR